MENVLPFVTAMIVVRNEENYIEPALRSFLNQDYPKDRYEILIIDGMSEDHTIDKVKEVMEIYRKNGVETEIRCFENPKKLLAAGWNIGIKKAKGDYVVRIDAHAQADPALIRNCVCILTEKSDVVCVGGRLETEPLTEKGKIIADVLSSPFGVGDSKFRYANKSGYVDTVAYGMYRKEIFEKAGYFNEKFTRNQDNDMHGRIKKCGGKFYLDASIRNIYHSRETVQGMMRQAFGNGKWIIIGAKKSESKQGISLRHLIPLIFLISNILLIISSIFFRGARWAIAAMYLLYIGMAVIFACKKTRNILAVLKMCGYYWLLHVSYGVGSLVSIFKGRI